jgi:hypothetical protein
MTAKNDKPADKAVSFSVEAEERERMWVKIDVVTVPVAGAMFTREHKEMMDSLKDELMILLASGKVRGFTPKLHGIKVRKIK